MNYEHLRQHSLVNLQHSNTKFVYDHKSMLQWQGSSSLGAVDATTMNCLHSLGLLHLATTQQWSLLPALAATRGDRGDATESRSRAAKRKPTPCRTPLPSILLANVHSSENKLDYLKLDLSTIPEMRDCCAIILTETWLNSNVPDDAVGMDGANKFPVGQALCSHW